MFSQAIDLLTMDGFPKCSSTHNVGIPTSPLATQFDSIVLHHPNGNVKKAYKSILKPEVIEGLSPVEFFPMGTGEKICNAVRMCALTGKPGEAFTGDQVDHDNHLRHLHMALGLLVEGR